MKGGEKMQSNSVQMIASQVFSSNSNVAVSDETVKAGFNSLLERNLSQRNSRTIDDSQRRAVATKVMPKNTVKEQKVESSDQEPTSSQNRNKVQFSNKQQLELCVGMLTELTSKIQNKYNISQEEFEDAMEKLGMVMIDLFDTNKLTQLYLNLEGAGDMSALLTDESLAMGLQDFLNSMAQIGSLEDIGLSKEELNDSNFLGQLSDFQELLRQADELNGDEVNPKTEELFEEESEVIKAEEPKAVEVEEVDELEELEESTDEEIIKTQEPMNKEETNARLGDHESSAKHETKHKTTKEIDIVVNGTTQMGQETKIEFISHLSHTTQGREIVEQIVRQIKVNINPQHTSMEMVLTPETLGKINLTVTSKNGIMTAHMVAHSEAAKNAIESELNILKDTLNEQGLKVDKVEVTVAAEQFDFMNDSQMHQSQQQHNSSKRTFHTSNVLDDEEVQKDQSVDQQNVNASIGKGTQIDLNA